MSNQEIRVGCGILLFNDKNQFLLMKRKSKHGEGTYAFCGGWIEFGETFEQAVKREAKEELNIDLKDIKFLTVSNNFFPSENKHTVSIIMAAKVGSDDISNMEPDKCESIDWYDDWNNLPSPLFVEYDKYINQEMIDNYLKG